MDQMANWVRFADAKATVLTAAFGVLLTMLMSNAEKVVQAVKIGCLPTYVVGTLSAATLVSAGYTLFWLVRAIRPRNVVSHEAVNRFAWPSLVGVTPEALGNHSRDVSAHIDAWQQVISLSSLASRKFDACGRAINGFASLAVFSIATVASSVIWIA
ncbi:hypothetical protein [Sanguibacter keddieii]|nr:hypothetical protein [Sanguibacter keddieii]